MQYNFYGSDRRWGRMFVSMCPYLPFSARVCLNKHHWLANRMREADLDFQSCSNAFLRCSTPERLQQLADTLTAEDLSSCGQKRRGGFTQKIFADPVISNNDHVIKMTYTCHCESVRLENLRYQATAARLAAAGTA